MEKDKGTDEYLVSSLFNQYRTHLHATRTSGVPGVFDVMARTFVAEHRGKRVRDSARSPGPSARASSRRTRSRGESSGPSRSSAGATPA